MRNSNPNFAAAQIHEFATLHAPSPMNATTLPAIGPRFSWNVKMSARIWQGCSSSVSALMVGMPENLANSSTSLCAKVRMTAPWIMRPSTRAVSLIGSPRPSWMSLALRNIGRPPSSRMPTSNETRVRVDDLENISAQVWPASGCGLVMTALALEHSGVVQNFLKVRARQFFQ